MCTENDEARMSNDEGMTKRKKQTVPFVIRDFVIRFICGIVRGGTLKAMYENTEFTLSRDCEAIQIPSGQKTTIPAGTQGVITQSLGGSYTIATYQGLARESQRKISMLSG